MTALAWDQVGERYYETGTDRGVLYRQNASGVYNVGYAWNGLTAVTESPTGAEPTPQYADNIKYLNLLSIEEFEGTIEAFTYPDAFAECNGEVAPQVGVTIGQQPRATFGFAYRTRLGNDLEATEYGYKLHLVYGALASPSEKPYNTINETPEPVTFSWDFTTTPVEVTGHKPTASLVIDSTKVDAGALAALELILYGSVGVDPMLPTPDDVLALFDGTFTAAIPTAPTFVSATETITIPTVTGVVYTIDGEVVPAGDIVITEDTMVVAVPATGYYFPAGVDDDWLFDYTP